MVKKIAHLLLYFISVANLTLSPLLFSLSLPSILSFSVCLETIISFDPTTYTVSEEDRTVTLRVVRTGYKDVSVTASVTLNSNGIRGNVTLLYCICIYMYHPYT